MTSQISKALQDSKRQATFTGAGVQHTYHVSNQRQRRDRVVDHWQTVRELGNGTYGRVSLQECVSGRNAGQLRAVKQISKAGQDREYYHRELEAMIKFSHERYEHCFVRFDFWFDSGDSVFLSMQYIQHGDLQKHLTKPVPEDEAKQIMAQLVEGVKYMHENDFAHRDLKPGNILVVQPSPHWWVKIGDFGISKRAAEGSTGLRTRVGTEGYVAPEVLGIFTLQDASLLRPNHDRPSYTFAIDMWSLGEIAFKIITNQSTFSQREDLFSYVVLANEFPLKMLLEVEASSNSQDFIRRAMAAAPHRRLTAPGACSHPWLQDLLKELSDDSEDHMRELDDDYADDSLGVAKQMAPVAEISLLPTAQWTTIGMDDARSYVHSDQEDMTEPAKKWHTTGQSYLGFQDDTANSSHLPHTRHIGHDSEPLHYIVPTTLEQPAEKENGLSKVVEIIGPRVLSLDDKLGAAQSSEAGKRSEDSKSLSSGVERAFRPEIQAKTDSYLAQASVATSNVIERGNEATVTLSDDAMLPEGEDGQDYDALELANSSNGIETEGMGTEPPLIVEAEGVYWRDGILSMRYDWGEVEVHRYDRKPRRVQASPMVTTAKRGSWNRRLARLNPW